MEVVDNVVQHYYLHWSKYTFLIYSYETLNFNKWRGVKLPEAFGGGPLTSLRRSVDNIQPLQFISRACSVQITFRSS